MKQRVAFIAAIGLLIPASWQVANGQAENVGKEQTFDVGVGPGVAATIGYSRVFQDSGFHGGINLWYSFEERTATFDHNVWDVFGVDVYTRRIVNPEVQLDVGISLLSFAPEDDTSDTGTFAGAYGAAYFGQKIVYLGLEMRVGATRLYDQTEFGLIASPRLKLQFSF